MQFEGAQLSHKSNEPEKNEDRTKIGQKIGQKMRLIWENGVTLNSSPMIHITVQPNFIVRFCYK